VRSALLLFALAACGNDHRGTTDGGGGSADGDGGIGDGGMGDAGDVMVDADPNVRGTVSVKIVDRSGDPQVGMHVVFVDTDATVTDVVTDAAGMASASVYPNANVTAIRERDIATDGQPPIAYQLTTVLALVPGDTITLIAAPGSVPSTEDTFTQGVVPLPAEYVIGASKQGSTATYTTLGPHGLVTGDTVVVNDSTQAAYNGAWTVSGAPSAMMFTANIGSGGVPDGTGGTAAKAERFTVSYPAYGGAQSYAIYSPCGTTDAGTATSATIRLRAGCSTTPMDLVVVARGAGNAVIAWTQATGVAFTANGSTTITAAWQAPSAITATYSNPTTGVTGIELRRFQPYVRPPLLSATGTPAAPLMVTAPLPAAAAMQTKLTCSGGTCVSDTAEQIITQQVDGTATTYALDVDANLLPWLTATWVPNTITMNVTVTGTAAYDLFHASIVYTRDSVDQTIYTWRVFGPVAGTFKFPTLPSTVPGNPNLTANSRQATYSVDVCESDAVGGYRDAIKNPYGAFGTCRAASSPTTVRFGGTKNRISSN
jgi:hypothetical protein